MLKSVLFMLFIVLGINAYSQCACCGSMSGFSGGESTPGAFSLGQGNWLAEAYGDFRSFNGISNEQRIRDFGVSTSSATAVNHMVIGLAGIRYGLTNRLILLLQQPVFSIAGPTVSSKTIGDALSLLNYTAFNRKGFVIDVQGGMEWPTGQAVHFSNGSSVSTGSGSYDPVAGISLKKNFARSFLRASGFFKYTTRGFNGIYYGNFCSQQVSYTWFLSKVNNVCGIQDSLFPKAGKPVYSLGLQLQGEWAQMQAQNRVFIENTGSYVALGALNFAVTYKSFTVPLTVSVPVYQRYHGEQNIAVIRVRIGITKTFS